MSAPRSRCHCVTASLSVRFHFAIAASASVGQVDVAQALGDGHVVGVDHAGHALAHGPQVLEVGVDEGLRRRRLPACGSP